MKSKSTNITYRWSVGFDRDCVTKNLATLLHLTDNKETILSRMLQTHLQHGNLSRLQGTAEEE